MPRKYYSRQPYDAAMAPLPAVYLAAGEGRRLRPLTDDRPKAMLDVGGVSLAERALRACARPASRRSSPSPATRARRCEPLGDLVAGERFNPRYAEHGNVYSLWCARDVVRGGCYIVNCDVLFEDAIARRLVARAAGRRCCARPTTASTPSR